jgi:carboxypeptidase C (cathepsin A)
VPFEVYSGYLDLPAANGAGKKAHYVFTTSRGDKTKDPVTLWLQGGPGCSSLEGMFYENGPYIFPANHTDLVVNKYGWNNVSNMLWIESPPGVGFSIAGDPTNWN